jgi:hypothetical protein
VSRVADSLRRFDRDYASGDLSAGNYERLSATATTDLAGATAARDQLVTHADDVRATAASADDTIMDNMAALREAIAAYVSDGANIDEVRFKLRRLYAHFTVRETAGDVFIVPTLRADALDELASANRIPLRLTTNANGLTT